MATVSFDGWETQFYGGYLPDGYGGQDYLMHFRTKGSKNGVRRYQNPDGTWTPLGLKERRVREGWGERRAARREARRAAMAERRAAKAAARSENLERARQYKAQQAEIRRKRNPKNLTDEELRTGIERLKMEQEYRELSKSPMLKLGESFVTKYLENKAIKDERSYQARQDTLKFQREMEKMKEQTKQTELRTKADEAKAKADEAKAKTDLLDIQKGTRMKQLKNEKRSLKLKKAEFKAGTTVMGGLRKLMNKTLTSAGSYKSEMVKGKAQADSILYGKQQNEKWEDHVAEREAEKRRKAQKAAKKAAKWLV